MKPPTDTMTIRLPVASKKIIEKHAKANGLTLAKMARHYLELLSEVPQETFESLAASYRKAIEKSATLDKQLAGVMKQIREKQDLVASAQKLVVLAQNEYDELRNVWLTLKEQNEATRVGIEQQGRVLNGEGAGVRVKVHSDGEIELE